ncbi:hemoglobin [Nonomuraea maritima]|uniref:Hemoglobin n=1 Tax=Nonomuraea maritima TaxID=683260 RepID=A0A1G8WYA1_9ACTN|nr:hemoglobin [Nonomuraea maritima]
MAGDPLLRAMYPEEDLGPAEERMRLFLMQYWGGPRTYGERRGHPRLRMRHAPFHVDLAAHDAWLRHMRAAVEESHLPPHLERQLWDYLSSSAAAMINAR